MSSARDYLQHEYQPNRSAKAVVWLVSSIIAAFVLQLILMAPSSGSGAKLLNYLALSINGLQDWYLWTLVTHSLLHDTNWPWHILFTLVGLIFVGRELEPLLGPRKFVALYIGSIIFSALCWSAVHWVHGGGHIGAGAAIFAFLVVLSQINPGMEFSVFYFPVTFRLRFLVWIFVAVEAIGLVFYEIQGAPAPLWLSPSTHLGGMLAGWLYYRFFHAAAGLDRVFSFSLPGWLRFRSAKAPTRPAPTYGRRRPTAALRADVDRILDKINSHGFGSLNEEEKRTLDEAKDLLSKH